MEAALWQQEGMTHKHTSVSTVSGWVREARHTEDRLRISFTGGQEAATLTDGEGSRAVAVVACADVGTDREGQTTVCLRETFCAWSAEVAARGICPMMTSVRSDRFVT